MAIQYAIVNRNTGEIENNCGICGYGIVGNHQDFDANKERIGTEHIILEIATEEKLELAQSLMRNSEDRLVYSKKLDTSKAKEKLKDRKKDKDNKPEKAVIVK